jgi:hypothetical protein
MPDGEALSAGIEVTGVIALMSEPQFSKEG